MSSRNSTSNTPPILPTLPFKLCHIIKRPDFEGYGFNLHSEKSKQGQYIGKVDSNSPAEAAGLKEGDRIIEVNGVAIGNEMHKQVVQRIKALACEVRLLLVDADGGSMEVVAAAVTPQATKETANGSGSKPNNNVVGGDTPTTEDASGTKQEIPGVSANISSISMISSKRMSNASSQSRKSESSVSAAPNMNVNDKGLTGGITTATKTTEFQAMEASTMSAEKNGNGNMSPSTPPPPSTIMAAVGNINNNTTAVAATVYNNSNGQAATPNLSSSSKNANKAGELFLPVTAAEMRAKLLSKKKHDPKNESVDLKRKYDIIQKL